MVVLVRLNCKVGLVELKLWVLRGLYVAILQVDSENVGLDLSRV